MARGSVSRTATCSACRLSDKYASTWERVVRRITDFTAPANLGSAREQLALTLLFTYALGNADCHTKNLALLYSSESDVRMAPIYDMLTILAYDAYAENPPGMFIGGRKSWEPGKALWTFLQQSLGFEPARQREFVDRSARQFSIRCRSSWNTHGTQGIRTCRNAHAPRVA